MSTRTAPCGRWEVEIMDPEQSKLTAPVMRQMAQATDETRLPIIVRYVPSRRVMRRAEPMRGVRDGGGVAGL